MRLTIIPSDDLVLIDGRPQNIELAGYPQLDGVHAVQWDDDLGYGELEFDNRGKAEFKHNEKITSIDAYQDIIVAAVAAAAKDAARAGYG